MPSIVLSQQEQAGFELLSNYLVNDALRLQPSLLVYQIKGATGEDVTDLRKSAVATDRYEQQALDYNVLIRMASKLGRADASRVVSIRGEIDEDSLRSIEQHLAQLPEFSANYGPVKKAYAEAFFAGISQGYVEQALPAEARRQRAEIRIVSKSGDLGVAHSVIVEAKRAGAAAESTGERAAALAYRASAEEAADEIAQQSLLSRIAEVASRERHLPVDQVLEHARMEVRALGVSGKEAKVQQRIAWMPISRTRVEEVVSMAREQVQGQHLEMPLARTSAGRAR